jgi:hypothetical protein
MGWFFRVFTLKLDIKLHIQRKALKVGYKKSPQNCLFWGFFIRLGIKCYVIAQGFELLLVSKSDRFFCRFLNFGIEQKKLHSKSVVFSNNQ